MQCFIYKSLKKDQLYLYLTQKDDFSTLPEALFKSVSPMQFVMELELTPGRKLARENPEKVIENLNNKGFFIQMPPSSLTPSQKLQ
jgi:uncharacterized protein